MTMKTAVREFVFWATVLLALPACDRLFGLPELDKPDPGTNLVKGTEPRSSAVFCDIEQERRCATADDIAIGIPLSEAAIALEAGINSAANIGLDYSPEARGRCSDGPEAILFHGPFPTGLQVCVNCGDIIGPGKTYPDALAVCQAQCHDFVFGSPGTDGALKPVVPPSAATIADCALRTRLSTNIDASSCISSACNSIGTPISFLDPRRIAESVDWTDRIGTEIGPFGGDLSRSTTPDGNFSASAVSSQWIRSGGGWMEFSMNRSDRAVTIGLSEIPAGCAAPADCPDTDAGRDNIHFGLAMGPDGFVYVRVRGVFIDNGGFPSWGAYGAGSRFRITVRENLTDLGAPKTATVSFGRVEACPAGQQCPVVPFYTHQTSAAAYPLRIKASFRDTEVVVGSPRVVRIR